MPLRLVRGLGAISPRDATDAAGTFELINELSNEEFDKIDEAVRSVTQITANLQLQLIERNRMRIRSVSEFYANAISMRQRSEHFDPRRAVENLSVEILNWLTATRLFLDHHLTMFSRTYGKDSPQHQRLKLATNQEYDSSPAYRVLYKLRDYTQHCGFPMDQVTSTARNPSANDWTAQVAFTAGREALLANFDWNAATRDDLAAMPERVDVLDLIETASPAFRRIFAEITRVRLESMATSIDTIRKAVESLPDRVTAPHLMSFTVGTNNIPTEISATMIPIDLVQWLDNPAKTSEYLQKLVADASIDSASESLSADALNSQTRQSLRIGAAVMNAYYEAGGVGGDFADKVNGIADDLGDVTPVLVGTTTIAAVSLSMAAAALGTNARDLAGGLTT